MPTTPDTQPEPVNATITVTYGDAEPIIIVLDGPEVGTDSAGGKYLNNASRHFIADEVEKALTILTTLS